MNIPLLTRRRIEAEFARDLFAEMKTSLGEAEATRILANAIIRMARHAGAHMAGTEPPTLDGFRAIQSQWSAEDALSVEVLESTPTTFHFNVTRCRYAEMYRELGLAQLGATLSCNRDGAFCEGYDPALKLTRTRTIMGGASHCDFRFERRPDEEGKGGEA
jgi:hypothetical protein